MYYKNRTNPQKHELQTIVHRRIVVVLVEYFLTCNSDVEPLDKILLISQECHRRNMERKDTASGALKARSLLYLHTFHWFAKDICIFATSTAIPILFQKVGRIRRRRRQDLVQGGESGIII